MSRPQLGLRSWGSISRQMLPDGRVRVEGRYRGQDGIQKRFRAVGRTEEEARSRLAGKAQTPLPASVPTLIDLTLSSTIDDLGVYWISKLRLLDGIREQSINRYEWTLDHEVSPIMGHVRIEELTTGYIERTLLVLASRSKSRASRVRSLLKLALDEAIRLGVLSVNPVLATTVHRIKPKNPQALSPADVRLFRDTLRQWTLEDRTGQYQRSTMPLDFVNIVLGSSLRIGEVLALQSADVRPENRRIVVDDALIAVKGLMIDVNATIAYVKGKGHFRQPMLKHSRQRRELFVSGFASDALIAQMTSHSHGAIFATRTGHFVTPAQMRRWLRQFIQDTGVDRLIETYGEPITPHTLRRTVATALNDPQLASELLGHANLSTTETSYLQRSKTVDPRTALILMQQFATDFDTSADED